MDLGLMVFNNKMTCYELSISRGFQVQIPVMIFSKDLVGFILPFCSYLYHLGHAQISQIIVLLIRLAMTFPMTSP